MGLWESIKAEMASRDQEDDHIRVATRDYAAELEEERQAAASRNLFRKIKPIDNFFAKKEKEEIKTKVDAFRAEEQRKVAADRSGRSADIVKHNWKTLAIIAFVAIAIIIIFSIIGYNAYQSSLEKRYDEALALVARGDFKAANEKLGDSTIRDGRNLNAFVSAMASIGSYKGSPRSLADKISSIPKLEDAEAESARQKAIEQLGICERIQAQIEAINIGSLIEGSSVLGPLDPNPDALDPYYLDVLNLSPYQSAVSILERMANGEGPGAVYAQIVAIGEVTLSSEDVIRAARESYDALSDEEKKLVVNASVLESAEERLKELVAEHEAQLEAERQAYEAQLEAERQAAEAEERARERAEREAAWYNETVFRTRTGNCYHVDGCRDLTNLDYPLTRAEAESMGLQPCSKCRAGMGRPY